MPHFVAIPSVFARCSDGHRVDSSTLVSFNQDVAHVARWPPASFAIAARISLPLAVEQPADESSCAVQSSGMSRHGRSAGASLHLLICVDRDITLGEPKQVSKLWGRRGAREETKLSALCLSILKCFPPTHLSRLLRSVAPR